MAQKNYFECVVVADSPRDAFKLAKKDASNDYGNTSNTIAAKESYLMTTYETITNTIELRSIIKNSLDYAYPHIHSPAGCIRISYKPKTYIFYGYVK